MKTIIIIFMCMITTVLYAQTTDEIELGNRVNNIVLSSIPSLANTNYFIFKGMEDQLAVISKINNNYTYYTIELQHAATDIRTVTAKTITYRPVLDKIFLNFTPKVGVKRYVSEYVISSSDDLSGMIYFAIYKNNVKTFDYYLPGIIQKNSKESPVEDEILEFFYYYLIAQPDKL